MERATHSKIKYSILDLVLRFSSLGLASASGRPTRHHEHMTAWALFWIGTGFEIVGLTVGAVGLRSTWREFSTGDRFLGKEIDRVKRACHAVARWIRRILRLNQDVAVRTITGEAHALAPAAVARGAGYVGLPPIGHDPEAFAAEVEARLGKLHGELRAVRERVESEAKAREAADQQVLTDLETKVAGVEGLSRRIAVSGLRAQAFGWLCVALGFTLQATATPFT